jgi:LysR family transcriptional regulator, cyn operon transcriptional activator
VEYFIAVVDHGGVTRAANALYIAQPSLSQAIRALERELGVELFDRSGRQFELTEAGRTFEVTARRVVRDIAVARQRVDGVRTLRVGRLQLSAVADLTLHPLPLITRAFRDRHPGVEVWISDPGGASAVAAEVRQGRAELGFAPLPVKAGSLTVRPLGDQRMVLAMSAEIAAAVPDPVPQKALRDLPLIRAAGDGLADLLAVPELLPPPEEVALLSAFRQVTWELVMAGAGAAVLPEEIARAQLRGVVVRRTEPEIRRGLAVLFRPGQLSPAAAAFLEAATSMATPTNAAAAGESPPESNTSP